MTTSDIFFALVKAGLWEKEVRLAGFGKPNFLGIHRLAREQAVTGLVAAGMRLSTLFPSNAP